MALKTLKEIPSLAVLYRQRVLHPPHGDNLPDPGQSLNDKVCTIKYDITKLEVDAIVNAANSSLMGGGGVDGAIHRAAGRGLLKECKALDGCETGSAKITDAYDLPCKKVIHAVGPIYKNAAESEPLLRGCYRTALELAIENDCRSIAFSGISTGIYGYPKRAATRVAALTVRDFLTGDNASKLDKVVFCNFLPDEVDNYANILPETFPPTQADQEETGKCTSDSPIAEPVPTDKSLQKEDQKNEFRTPRSTPILSATKSGINAIVSLDTLPSLPRSPISPLDYDGANESNVESQPSQPLMYDEPWTVDTSSTYVPSSPSKRRKTSVPRSQRVARADSIDMGWQNGGQKEATSKGGRQRDDAAIESEKQGLPELKQTGEVAAKTMITRSEISEDALITISHPESRKGPFDVRHAKIVECNQLVYQKSATRSADRTRPKIILTVSTSSFELSTGMVGCGLRDIFHARNVELWRGPYLEGNWHYPIEDIAIWSSFAGRGWTEIGLILKQDTQEQNSLAPMIRTRTTARISCCSTQEEPQVYQIECSSLGMF